MNNQEVTVKVQLSDKDLSQFQWSTLSRQAFVWVYALLLLGSFVYIIHSAVNNQIEEVPMTVWILVFVAIALAVTITRGMRKVKKSRFMNEMKTYTVMNETVKMESESLSAILKWEDFVKYLITDHAIYLYMNETSAHVIPVRYLSVEETQFITELAKAKVKIKSRWKVIASRFVIYIMIFIITVGVVQYLNR